MQPNDIIKENSKIAASMGILGVGLLIIIALVSLAFQ